MRLCISNLSEIEAFTPTRRISEFVINAEGNLGEVSPSEVEQVASDCDLWLCRHVALTSRVTGGAW